MNHGPLLVVLPLCLILLGACAPAPDGGDAAPAAEEVAAVPAADPAYVQEIDDWREERRTSLTSEDGWLTLVGLFWLEPGENRFGSAADNDLVFPAGSPEHLGTLVREGETVRVAAAPDTGLTTADGEPVTRMQLATDMTGEPTVLTVGSLSFYPIVREEMVGIRVKDPESPARSGFEGLEYFALDPAYRVEARLEPEPGTVAVPNVLGQMVDSPSPGRLVFTVAGREVSIRPIMEEGDEDMFLIFGDETNRTTTYGGGRFLYAPAPGADGRTVIDFNRSYNPPCAFTPYATCPLPPADNKLALAIEAGEKKYAGEIPH